MIMKFVIYFRQKYNKSHQFYQQIEKYIYFKNSGWNTTFIVVQKCITKNGNITIFDSTRYCIFFLN